MSYHQQLYNTLQDLWSQQQISCSDVDYNLWKKEKSILKQMAQISDSCLFAVDVYKGVYDFASDNFDRILGYDLSRLRSISQEGDYLETRFHPEDIKELLCLRINLSHYIYNQPSEERNNYRNIFEFRIRNARDEYVNVISRHQVLIPDKKGKAWIIMGMMDLSPDQSPLECPRCSVVNRKTGEIFDATRLMSSSLLTSREQEILKLIGQGLLSKEIAYRLNLSLHTIHNHRKNILSKLHVNNAMEAVTRARKLGEI